MSVPLQDAGVVEVFDFVGIWTYQNTLVASTITTGFGRLLDVVTKPISSFSRCSIER